MIWGGGMVAQSVGMNSMGAFTFTFVRNIFACLALLPFLFFRRGNLKHHSPKSYLKVGSILGSIICLGYVLQTIALPYTTVGKAGFITTLYIIIVPLLGVLLFHKRIQGYFYIFVVMALVGTYFLCIDSNFRLSGGDFVELLGSFAFSFQIIFVGKYSREFDVIYLSFIQFFFAALFALIGLPFEHPTLEAIHLGIVPLLYSGLLSSGVGMTLQILGQKNLEDEVASLIMSLEAVFSLLAGFVILHQALTTRDIIGCSLVFLAVMISQVFQLPSVKRKFSLD